MKRAALVAAGVVLVGCGAQGVGPTAVATPAPQATPFVYEFERWQVGLAMHHCFAGDIDEGQARWAAGELAQATGIAQTSEGECNVWWVVDKVELRARRSSEDTVAFCEPRYLQGTLARNGARLVFEDGGALVHAGVHEGGHALGLGHSQIKGDVMLQHPQVMTFSEGEREKLAVMYRVR